MTSLSLGPNIHFEYRPVKAGPVNYSSHHDFVLADVANFEAGCRAQQEGFAAVCIDTMSDSGVAALRSVLDIPVFGPGKVSMLSALMLGDRFSILTMASRWKPLYKKALDELGLHHKCASVRAIEVPPDNQNLLSGKEEDVFPLLEAAGRRAIEEELEFYQRDPSKAPAWLLRRSQENHQLQAEQDKRLEERIKTPWKRWKTGTDDYHNRSQRAAYIEAYEDMFRLCSPPSAPWHVVAANDKKWARVRSLELICEVLGAGVDLSWPEPDAELVKIAEKALGKKLD